MERETESEAGEFGFSLVRGGPLYGIQRALRLVPPGHLGIRRRIAAFVAVSWLPVVGAAIATGRAYDGDTAEVLFHHFGVHARSLVAIPLLLGAEALADWAVPILIRYFVDSGLVPSSEVGRFRDALRAAARLRDSRWGVLLIIGLVVAFSVASLSAPRFVHEVAWAISTSAGQERLSFGGLYYLIVSRPMFLLLSLVWLWRIGVLWFLLRRIAQIDLRLVAVHPDRSAGLGFLDYLPVVLLPVALALSTVLAAALAHEVLYHGVDVRALHPLAVAWLFVTQAIFLSPLLPFFVLLVRLRRRARLRYGDLLGDHGRLLEARWLARSRAEGSLLGAPEISVAADAIPLYGAVERLRPLPFGVRTVAALALTVLLPWAPLFAIEIPIKDLLLKIAQALI